MISLILKIAGYTYGPLVALYVLGLYSKVKFKESLVPVVCICAPLFTYIIDTNSASMLGGYKMGFEVAFVNVGITLIGLMLIRERKIVA